MAYMKYLIIVATLSLVLANCSTFQDVVPEKSFFEIYSIAKQKMQDGNFKGAITQLEALDSHYPFGPYSQQVQLDLIYAYYKSADLLLMKASIDRFIRLNPTHMNIDYVMYMRGLADMALYDVTLQGFFGIVCSDCDPQNDRAAFRNFRQLIQYFPNSKYVTDANKRLLYLKEHLAKYELSVTEYYTKRGAYIAAINRIERMLREYPDTQATRDALPLMEYSYKKLQLNTEAEKVAKIITDNP